MSDIITVEKTQQLATEIQRLIESENFDAITGILDNALAAVAEVFESVVLSRELLQAERTIFESIMFGEEECELNWVLNYVKTELTNAISAEALIRYLDVVDTCRAKYKARLDKCLEEAQTPDEAKFKGLQELLARRLIQHRYTSGRPHNCGDSCFCGEIEDIKEQMEGIAHEEIIKVLGEATVLIVEDGPACIGIGACVAEMTNRPPRNSGIFLARSYREGKIAIDRILEAAKSGDTIVHIADFSIPKDFSERDLDISEMLTSDDHCPDDSNGTSLIAQLQWEVSSWNQQHPEEQPLKLVTYCNSTKYAEDIRLRNSLNKSTIIGGMESGSQSKEDAIPHIIKILLTHESQTPKTQRY